MGRNSYSVLFFSSNGIGGGASGGGGDIRCGGVGCGVGVDADGLAVTALESIEFDEVWAASLRDAEFKTGSCARSSSPCRYIDPAVGNTVLPWRSFWMCHCSNVLGISFQKLTSVLQSELVATNPSDVRNAKVVIFALFPVAPVNGVTSWTRWMVKSLLSFPSGFIRRANTFATVSLWSGCCVVKKNAKIGGPSGSVLQRDSQEPPKIFVGGGYQNRVSSPKLLC